MRVLLLSATLVVGAVSAAAEPSVVRDRATFLNIVQGKTLTRPLVRLQVGADGSISGTGAMLDVSGEWDWRGGYFCRELYWGGDALGYNCQEVRALGSTIRFTSDEGRGESADFRLR